MNLWIVLLIFFHLNLLNILASAHPHQNLGTFVPDVEKETVVATQLQVSARTDRDYEFKEVPLFSRKGGKEIMLAENKLEEKPNDATNKESVDETPKAAVKEVGDDENITGLENVEESPQNVVCAVVKPYKVKHSASTDSGNPVYITIPIYVNSGSGLPVTLSISGQQVPLKAYPQGIASRWDTMRKESSPTSLYNKLL